MSKFSKILIILFTLFSFAANIFAIETFNWNSALEKYFEGVSKYSPQILVTNPFYNLKYFLYSRVIKNDKKIWKYLNQIIAQIYLYRQNVDFVKYMLKEYLKMLNYVDKEAIDYKEFLNHFFVLSYIEKSINEKELQVSDEILKLIDNENLNLVLSSLDDKSEFEKFYFLFRLNLVCQDDVENLIKNDLEKYEEFVISYILKLDDEAWLKFKNESPYDKLTIMYLEFLRDLK
jgi:hypothetical protein